MPLSLAQFRQQNPVYDDVPDEKLVPALKNKFYPQMADEDFHRAIGYTPQMPADASYGSRVLDTLKGEGDVLATGVGNLATRAINSGADLATRATGNGPMEKPLIPNPQLGPSGRRLTHAVGDMLPDLPRTANGLDVSDQELRETLDPSGKIPIEQLRAQYKVESDKSLSQIAHESGTVGGDILGHTLDVAGDVANVLPAAGAVKSGVGLVRGVTTAAGDAAASAAQQASRSNWERLGFKTGQDPKAAVGQAIAGDTVRPALINSNADVFNTVGNAEARVPHGTPLSPESLEAARAPMNGVYDRVAKGLPSGTLDNTAQKAVQGAGGNLTSDATKSQLQNIKANVLGAKDGEGLVNQLRSMRQEGFTRAASEDVDQQQLGRAQLDIANAIEEHIGRNLPANGDVSLEQFQGARKALAKNYTIQNALRGSDVDPNVLARLQRTEPGLLDGPLKDAADFAANNREVVGLPSRVNAPGVLKDIRNIDIMHPVGSTATALAGGFGRRLATGGPAAGRAAARAALPGSLGDEFAPLTPKAPEPPPGMAVAGEGAGGPHGPPAGRPGDIPLADVLSHGVERSPPPGLTAGPMGAPQGEGLPFRVNAEHAAGGLGLAPEPSLGDLVAELHRSVGSNADLPGVMSQGVPEGTMTRTPAPAAGTRSMRGPGQGPALNLGDLFANNASGESAASQEAINRGTRNLVQIDPDGNESPVLRDVTQIDRSAPKGHLIVDKDTNQIVSRGGLNKAGAEGLRNRWASRQRLGDTFVSK